MQCEEEIIEKSQHLPEVRHFHHSKQNIFTPTNPNSQTNQENPIYDVELSQLDEYQVSSKVNEDKENMQCAICHNFFCEPRQLPCNHMFCLRCLKNSANMKKQCPLCRKEFQKSQAFTTPMPALENKIRNLPINCKHKSEGCKWKGKVIYFSQHYQNCNYKDCHMCSHQNCQMSFISKQAQLEHEQLCGLKRTVCHYCNKITNVGQLVDHFQKDCQEMYIKCQECKGYYKRLTTHECHIFSDYEEKDSSNKYTCSNSLLGCKFHGTRKELQRHMYYDCLWETSFCKTCDRLYLKINQEQHQAFHDLYQKLELQDEVEKVLVFNYHEEVTPEDITYLLSKFTSPQHFKIFFTSQNIVIKFSIVDILEIVFRELKSANFDVYIKHNPNMLELSHIPVNDYQSEVVKDIYKQEIIAKNVEKTCKKRNFMQYIGEVERFQLKKVFKSEDQTFCTGNLFFINSESYKRVNKLQKVFEKIEKRWENQDQMIQNVSEIQEESKMEEDIEIIILEKNTRKSSDFLDNKVLDDDELTQPIVENRVDRLESQDTTTFNSPVFSSQKKNSKKYLQQLFFWKMFNYKKTSSITLEEIRQNLNIKGEKQLQKGTQKL